MTDSRAGDGRVPEGGLLLLSPGAIGRVAVRNRIIRSATSETLADESGRVDEKRYWDLYAALAASHVGLIFCGHAFVEPRGSFVHGMTGLSDDANVPFFKGLTENVHDSGARIFAQLNHAGSKSKLEDEDVVGPSAIPNPETERVPRALSEEDITGIVDAYGAAAARACASGFDGIHLHAGHGYLLSQFLSPLTNRRDDGWGGDLAGRSRLLLQIVRNIRREVGSAVPVTVKLGARDCVPSGLTLIEGTKVAEALDAEGVQAIEVSAGLTTSKVESSLQYSGVSRRRALADKMIHRAFSRPVPEAYFRRDARAIRRVVRCPVILVGGLRKVETMESVLREGDADFVSLARPFIRQPDLVLRIEEGTLQEVACVSCNICAMHEGTHGLKCWRESNRDLAAHAWYRLTGKLLKTSFK